MKRLLLLFFTLSSLLYGNDYILIPKTSIYLPEEFVLLWREAQARMHKKEVYVDTKQTVEETFLYEDKSFTLKFEIDPYRWKVALYDPNDPLLKQYKQPFIVIESYDKTHQVDIGKTDTLSGKQIVTLARSLQKYFKFETFLILDEAITTQCQADGVLCKDAALIRLKNLGIFTTGKSYYEQLGAHSLFPEGFHKAANFIYNLPVNALLKELDSLAFIPKAKSLKDRLENIVNETALNLATTTLSDLARHLKKHAGDSSEDHRRFHEFHDYFIADRGSFEIEYLEHALTNSELPDSLVKRHATTVFAGINQIFDFLQVMANYEVRHSTAKDVKFIETVKGILADFPISYKQAQTLYIKRKAENCIRFTGTPTKFSLAHRSTPKSIIRYQQAYQLLEPYANAPNVYKAATDRLNKILKKENKLHFQYQKDFLELMADYDGRDKNTLPPGYLWGVYSDCKYIIHVSDTFEFKL